MTEKERMHLVDQIGECMDGAEVEQPKRTADVVIDVKARGNRIVVRDYIEINIFVSGVANREPTPGEARETSTPARE